MMHDYYVKLKEGQMLDTLTAEKIRELEQPTYEERFPKHLKDEVYYCGTLKQCQIWLSHHTDVQDCLEIVPIQ